MKNQFLMTSLAVAVSAFVMSAPAYAENDADDFVKKAAMSDMFEIESSRVALERSQNADVRAFAQQMIDDHTAASAKLKAAVAAGGVDAGLIPASLDDKHQKKVAKLREEDANDFDEEYVDAQETAHRKAVRLFKSYSEDGDNTALKAHAGQTLPTLQSHKDHVETLEEKVDDAEDAR